MLPGCKLRIRSSWDNPWEYLQSWGCLTVSSTGVKFISLIWWSASTLAEANLLLLIYSTTTLMRTLISTVTRPRVDAMVRRTQRRELGLDFSLTCLSRWLDSGTFITRFTGVLSPFRFTATIDTTILDNKKQHFFNNLWITNSTVCWCYFQ